MKQLQYILLLVLAFSLGCEGDKINADNIEITIKSDELSIRNLHGDNVYYLIVERETTALIDWIPTVTDDTPVILPGEEKLIPYIDIMGYNPGDEQAVFYYWPAIKDRGSLVPGNVDQIIIDLK